MHLTILQNITARRNANFYNITNGKGKVATFCLFKTTYKLGEDIVGMFDFSSSTIRCVQVCVDVMLFLRYLLRSLRKQNHRPDKARTYISLAEYMH